MIVLVANISTQLVTLAICSFIYVVATNATAALK